MKTEKVMYYNFARRFLVSYAKLASLRKEEFEIAAVMIFLINCSICTNILIRFNFGTKNLVLSVELIQNILLIV